jgi:hypothetical protein
MRAIPRLLLGLSSGYVVLPVLSHAIQAADASPASAAASSKDCPFLNKPCHFSTRNGLYARTASPDPGPSAVPDWYGQRPQSDRVIDIEYFEDDQQNGNNNDESGRRAVIWSTAGVRSSHTGRPPPPQRQYHYNKQRPTRPRLRPRPTETLIEIDIDDGPELVPIAVPVVPIYTQPPQQNPTYVPIPKAAPPCLPDDPQCNYGYTGNLRPYNNSSGNDSQRWQQQQQQQEQRPSFDDNNNNQPQSNDWGVNNNQPQSNNWGMNNQQPSSNYGSNGGQLPSNNGNNGNNGQSAPTFGNNNERQSNFGNEFGSPSFQNQPPLNSGPPPLRNNGGFSDVGFPIQDRSGYEMDQPSFLNGNPISPFHPFYDNRVLTFR